jgi:hypothetical protein
MAIHIRRRKFIVTLSGAAAWPLAARAQQPAIPVVGMLSPRSRGASEHVLNVFRRGLNDAGYAEGQNVAIEYRLTEGRFDRLAEQAADLVRRQVSVIATPGSAAAALAAKAAAQTIPIVFGVAEDPVKLGLVASLARPGGNVTGINYFAAEVTAKRLGLLHELLPAAARIAVLVNPANVTAASSTRADAELAARADGLQTQLYEASTSQDIDTAFASASRAFLLLNGGWSQFGLSQPCVPSGSMSRVCRSGFCSILGMKSSGGCFHQSTLPAARSSAASQGSGMYCQMTLSRYTFLPPVRSSLVTRLATRQRRVIDRGRNVRRHRRLVQRQR